MLSCEREDSGVYIVHYGREFTGLCHRSPLSRVRCKNSSLEAWKMQEQQP